MTTSSRYTTSAVAITDGGIISWPSHQAADNRSRSDAHHEAMQRAPQRTGTAPSVAQNRRSVRANDQRTSGRNRENAPNPCPGAVSITATVPVVLTDGSIAPLIPWPCKGFGLAGVSRQSSPHTTRITREDCPETLQLRRSVQRTFGPNRQN